MWTVVAAVAGGYALAAISYVLGWRAPLDWLLERGGYLVPAASTLLVGLLVLARYLVVRLRDRRANEVEQSLEFRSTAAVLEAAEIVLKGALREKGIRGMLREFINVEDPSYSHTLRVERAAGLAELRDPLYEIKTDAKQRIEDLLATMPGGSIGVSGPRGVGKTTLLRHFCSPRFGRPHSGDRPDLRVLVSAPVQYDARDFVLHLFSAVCEAVLGPDEAEKVAALGSRPPLERRRLPIADIVLALGRLLAALLLVYGVVLLLSVIFSWKLNANLAPGVLLLVVGTVGWLWVTRWRRYVMRDEAIQDAYLSEYEHRRLQIERRYRSGDDSSARLQDTASQLLLGLTYQHTFARGWTGALKLPIGLEGGLSSTTTAMQRPMSYPELVARLSNFLKQASVSHRIVIGIDEMTRSSPTSLPAGS